MNPAALHGPLEGLPSENALSNPGHAEISARTRLLEQCARAGMSIETMARACGFSSSAALVGRWGIDDQTLIALSLLRRSFLRGSDESLSA
jgi:hypothetical protein